MTPRPVIIDCDPGQDDAVALLMALASPESLKVLGITCVAGNVPLDLTQRNARRVCVLAGRPDMPVFAGCPRPLIRPLGTAEAVHGQTGLDGSGLPEEPAMPLQDRHAVDFIIDTCLSAEDGEITLCPLGPLTNIAVAIVKAPQIVPKIREIVFMGGAALGPGNRTPMAEFNIVTDPHAAQVVFESGAPLVMFGLDVTHTVITTPARLDAIRAIGTPVAAAVTGMLTFYDRHDIERYGDPGAPLHDPCVIAWLLKPELFRGKDVHLAVETNSPLTMGRTVADWWGVTGNAPNATVMDRADSDGFYALVVDRLSRL
ncbi:MAG: nucleoside hydrolase [Alphaproteobacteria bacterium]|nr:nucleoside hydrolase [Alphaproteobacteria bacterium]